MSGLEIGLVAVFGTLILAGLSGVLMMLFRLGQGSQAEGPDRSDSELENRVERLERAFRALELEWVNVHGKVRSAIGRLSREDQVAAGKHKGGEHQGENDEALETPRTNRELEIMLRRGDLGTVR